MSNNNGDVAPQEEGGENPQDEDQEEEGVAFGGPGQPWTDDDINILVDLKDEQGLPWEQIAIEMGRTDNACKGKYRKVKKLMALVPPSPSSLFAAATTRRTARMKKRKARHLPPPPPTRRKPTEGDQEEAEEEEDTEDQEEAEEEGEDTNNNNNNNRRIALPPRPPKKKPRTHPQKTKPSSPAPAIAPSKTRFLANIQTMAAHFTDTMDDKTMSMMTLVSEFVVNLLTSSSSSSQ